MLISLSLLTNLSERHSSSLFIAQIITLLPWYHYLTTLHNLDCCRTFVLKSMSHPHHLPNPFITPYRSIPLNLTLPHLVLPLQLQNIRNVIRLTKENIEALNATFAKHQHPPSMYLQVKPP